MEEFEFEYDYDDSYFTTSSTETNKPKDSFHLLTCKIHHDDFLGTVHKELQDPIYFSRPISIESKSKDTIHIVMDGKTSFDLIFNSKYPFEPPRLLYYGPKYDFLTMSRLVIDFMLFRQEKWTIKESIRTILEEIDSIIQHHEKILDPTFYWTSEEEMMISFLNEMNVFSNASYFEEKREIETGKGTGYSKDCKESNTMRNLEGREKQKKICFHKIGSLLSSECFQSIVTFYNLKEKIQQFIYSSSHLYVYKNKDWLQSLGLDTVHAFVGKKLEPHFEEDSSIYFTEDENFVNTHYYHAEKNVIHKYDFLHLYKRLFMEIKDCIVFQNQENVRFLWNINHIQYWKFIVQSQNEPYFGGIFEFHVFFPHEYPNVPPKVHFMTTGGGKIRFNPNLYAEGKVCLSLLNTWSGEQWNGTTNCFLHVVQAIMVMILTDQPVQNEPAYSSDQYFDKDPMQLEDLSDSILLIRKYHFQIKYFTLFHAILEQMKNINHPMYPFMMDLLRKKKTEIFSSIESHLNKANDKTYFENIVGAKSFQSNGNHIFKNYVQDIGEFLDQIKSNVV